MSRRYTQPQSGPRQVDRLNPFSEGLGFVGVPDAAGVLRDSSGSAAVFTPSAGAPAVDVRLSGVSLIGKGASTNTEWDCGVNLATSIGTGDFTFLFYVDAPAGSPTALIFGDSGGSTLFGLSGGNWYSWLDAVTGPAVSATQQVVIWTRKGGTLSIYAGGASASGASATAFAASGNSRLLCRANINDYPWTGSLSLFALWPNRGMSADDANRLRADPWQLFPGTRSLLKSAALVPTLSPGPAALVLTGHAPTVAQPHNLAPAVASIALAGHAPIVAQPRSLAPSAAALVLAGHAPALAQSRSLSPGVATLVLSGHAPVVAQPRNLAPGVAALTLTGRTPTVAQPRSLAPAVAPIVLTGHVPTVTRNASITPGAASVTLAGHAPTIAQPHSLLVGTASLLLTGHAPAVTRVAANEFFYPLLARRRNRR